MGFLEISGLTKSFGQTEVLKGIDLDVEEGDFLVLVGPSGCGKSTLLNVIAGLENPTAGEIRIAGERVNELRPSERDIAMVFQSYALYPSMSVAQNLGFGLEMRGVPKAERETAIQEVAEMLQISQLLKRRPGQLSGGQRQRVAMGRALVRKPQVFLFDEPLSNLDAKLRVDMRMEIKRLHASLGTTIVYVTHDQIEAMTLASRIALLKDGILQQFGSPEDIYDNPANLFVADFMGSPAMNLVPAEVVEKEGEIGVALKQRANGALFLPAETRAAGPLKDWLGRTVTFGIRPEAVTDPDAADHKAGRLVEAECRADLVEPTGADTYIVTHLGGKEFTARLRANSRVKEDGAVTLAFNMGRSVFFDPKEGTRIA
ncbi:ABC transporter ATP-binding protein [Afifella sp. IM 167]|uniref:ABC transporter ATP-binding protein n=1 Tax=Afifella sp. IM 167 TaxID=2033586 RepID=UPI001CCBD11E|nr:sn-glycerol-3-phosphate ABC transporter ATP-binding protein UgpC [Afifella sp. IM 167]MBZ8132045.1 sugar ABC transporter ATP-binding protein [Afifella sp. IM 167]